MTGQTSLDPAPVVIAGAGPVGLTLALALALGPGAVRSIVLEKKPALDPHSRATLITPRSLELFDALRLLPRFLAEGQRNNAIRILSAPDRTPMLTFDFGALKDRTRTPFALALSQDRTERILLDAVYATGKVDVVFGDGLDRFVALEDHVRVHCASGRQIRTDVLVGADGAHSTVREQLGWRLEGKTYPTRAILADVRIDPRFDTDQGWLADPTSASFTIAIRFGPGVWRIIEAAVGDDVTEGSLPDRARILTERLLGAGAWRDTVWTSAYRKHERRSAAYVDGRVVLAGDAAHLNSPAGGQGMNAGLLDAERLAQAIAAALERPADAGLELARYQSDRIEAFDRDVRGLTDALESMEAAPAWLRNLLFSGVSVARRLGIEAIVARRLSMLGDARLQA